jgi:hypothetical protein
MGKSEIELLKEEIELLHRIALSAVALKINIEAGFIPPSLHALNRDLAAHARWRLGNPKVQGMKRTTVREATHVQVHGKIERIAKTWGIDAEGRLAKPSKGGFGVITESGERVGMMDAEGYFLVFNE